MQIIFSFLCAHTTSLGEAELFFVYFCLTNTQTHVSYLHQINKCVAAALYRTRRRFVHLVVNPQSVYCFRVLGTKTTTVVKLATSQVAGCAGVRNVRSVSLLLAHGQHTYNN